MSFRGPFHSSSSCDRALQALLQGESYPGEFRACLRGLDRRTLSTPMKFDHQMTLLHVAAHQRQTEAVKMLLEAGADYSQTDCFGRTPYDVAVLNNDYATLKVLQDFAVDQEISETRRRVETLTSTVDSLSTKRERLSQENTSLRKKNHGLVEDNTYLRRSARLAQQKTDQLRKEKEEVARDRDVYKERYTKMRDKVFKK